MNLNIGCGIDTWGDIRLDIARQQWWTNILGRKPSFNIIADAQALPFRDKVFDNSRMFEVLEHIPNYKKALQEMVRITKRQIHMTFPINSYVPYTMPYFLLAFDIMGFLNLLHLPFTARDHIWQIDPKKVQRFLESKAFTVEITKKDHAILVFLSHGRKAKIFDQVNRLLRKDHSWKIVATHKTSVSNNGR